MRKQYLTVLFLVSLAFLLLSCKNPTDAGSSIINSSEIPLITGIVMTSSDSPDPIAILGQPNEKSYIIEVSATHGKLNYQLTEPYPNPSSEGVFINFGIPVGKNITVWIVKGRLPGENTSGAAIYGNGYYVSPHFSYYKIILEGYIQAGYHRVEWNEKDDNGNYLPDGVYRIYIRIDNQLLWRNIWLHRNKENNFKPF